ncbi:UNVERIFIED_CONTAM: restriction endonuclease subunit S [Pseudomonas aeruginosa]|nr:restriction endonuclease subunit S [Pseudomonas aeruginosa]
MSWPRVKLSDVATINPRPPREVDESQQVTFVAMASASEDGHLLASETRVLSETKKGFTYFDRNDVLLAKITPCFENGKCLRPGQIPTEIGFGSTEFHVIRPDGERLDGLYLFYLVWNEQFRFLGEKSMSGAAGQKRVGSDFLKGFEIPLPPLPEQKRIAAILDKADAIRRKRQQAIQLADDFLRAVFLDMFGDPVTNPKGWNIRPIKEMAKVTTGNTPPRDKPEYYGDFIEWIKSDNINTPSDFLTVATEYLSEAGCMVGRRVPAGSTLLTCIAGSFDCIGNSAYADREVSFNQQINALTPMPGVNGIFLYALSKYCKKAIQAASTGGMKGMVSKGKLEEVRFICPPESMQQKFAEAFHRYQGLRKGMEHSQDGLSDEFSSISQKAFSGHL